MKKIYLFLITLLLLLLTPMMVFAAPETAVNLSENTAVNLSGALGAVLAIIALLLPFTLRAWARRNWDEEGQ